MDWKRVAHIVRLSMENREVLDLAVSDIERLSAISELVEMKQANMGTPRVSDADVEFLDEVGDLLTDEGFLD